MSDDKFDAWLASAATQYNRPPERVPREEMWREVESALDVDATPSVVTPLPLARTPWHLWSAPISAIAATLILAAGIGAGYWLRGREATTAPAQPTPVAGAPRSPSTDRTLDVAVQRHMADAEALLVAYRAVDGSTDTHVRGWARDVLGTTRLLMDSPAATDPARRRLLEDLELILVQIVQLPDSLPPGERALINRSMRRDQLLTRLRTAIPAGIVSGT